MVRRSFAWVLRPQFTAVIVAAAYLLGEIPDSFPLWKQVAVAALIGAGAAVTAAVAKDILARLAQRKTEA